MGCGVGGCVQHEVALQLRRSPVLLPLFLTCENIATVRRLPMAQPYRVSLWTTYVNSFHLCGSLCVRISPAAAVAAAAPSAPSVVLLACRCFSSSSAAKETPRLQHTSFTAYLVARRCRKAADLINSKTRQFHGRASWGPLRCFPLHYYTNSRHPRALRGWHDTASSLDSASVLAAVAARASAFHAGAACLSTPALLSLAAIPCCAGAPRGAWLSLSAAAALRTRRSAGGVPAIETNFTASATRGNGAVSLACAFRAAARTIAAVGAQYSTAAAAHGGGVTGAAAAFVPSIPPPANIPPESPLSASVHAAPQVRRPGSVVRMNEVIRHWWAVPAVGFNSILEAPVYRFELFHAAAPAPEEENTPQQMQDSQGLLAALAHDEALQDEPEEAGCIVLPNDIFGLPLRPDILYRCYWFYRCAIAGWTERMQLYKWEWPGSKRKIRPQCRTGMARLGWRKAPGHYEGVKAHPLRPHDQRKKINKRLLWQGLKIALSAKFAQGQLKVVDHFNLQSHKTKYCVQHLRRLLGRKCPSALLVHEGHSDVNDNFRYATAHILAVRRENVEGINVYNLLKYRQLVITEKALLKLIYNIQTYPEKRGWLPRYATPDGKPAPVPPAVEGWNREWKEKKEREKQAKFSKALLRERILKWKWSDETKGAVKIPRVDPFRGFRLARFSLHAPVMPWEKYEETYIDMAPLAEEEEEEDDGDFLEAKREWLQEQERLERLEDEDLPHAAAAAAAAAADVSGTGLSDGFRGTSNKSSSTADGSGSTDDSCSDSNGEDESLMEDSESDDEAAAAAAGGTDVEYLPPVEKYPSRPPEGRRRG